MERGVTTAVRVLRIKGTFSLLLIVDKEVVGIWLRSVRSVRVTTMNWAVTILFQFSRPTLILVETIVLAIGWVLVLATFLGIRGHVLPVGGKTTVTHIAITGIRNGTLFNWMTVSKIKILSLEPLIPFEAYLTSEFIDSSRHAFSSLCWHKAVLHLYTIFPAQSKHR